MHGYPGIYRAGNGRQTFWRKFSIAAITLPMPQAMGNDIRTPAIWPAANPERRSHEQAQ
ncbi:MAG: hypothetical protein R3F53_07630 [Gammaproteobacteria bacterium]